VKFWRNLKQGEGSSPSLRFLQNFIPVPTYSPDGLSREVDKLCALDSNGTGEGPLAGSCERGNNRRLLSSGM
jgi:hypothetical protein